MTVPWVRAVPSAVRNRKRHRETPASAHGVQFRAHESRPGRAAGQAPGCRCSLARTPRNRCRAIARPRARQARGCETAASDACRLLTSFGRSEVPSRSCCAVAQSTLLAAFCALLMPTAPPPSPPLAMPPPSPLSSLPLVSVCTAASECASGICASSTAAVAAPSSPPPPPPPPSRRRRSRRRRPTAARRRRRRP